MRREYISATFALAGLKFWDSKHLLTTCFLMRQYTNHRPICMLTTAVISLAVELVICVKQYLGTKTKRKNHESNGERDREREHAKEMVASQTICVFHFLCTEQGGRGYTPLYTEDKLKSVQYYDGRIKWFHFSMGPHTKKGEQVCRPTNQAKRPGQR